MGRAGLRCHRQGPGPGGPPCWKPVLFQAQHQCTAIYDTRKMHTRKLKTRSGINTGQPNPRQHIPVCLSVCLCIQASVTICHLSIYLSIYLSIIYPSIYLSIIYPSIYLSIYLSIYHLSVCLSSRYTIHGTLH